MTGSILQKLKLVRSVLFFILWPLSMLPQSIDPPVVLAEFSKVTTYGEITDYLKLLDKKSDLLKVEIIGQSVQGKNLYGLMYTSSKFGKDKNKIRVMIFAQQHGNEQSGKEGALLLARDLLKDENRYLFDRIDLLLIPQVNPDGSEINQRQNAYGADLNRNHLILTQPEPRALHSIFDRYLFEVTLDVHEYYPYDETWKNYGYRKNSEVTIGTTTNPNVSGKIRELSSNDYLPFIFRFMKEKGFSVFEYCPGGPPGINYIRHSTFDINDGRQSLGIQNTFSFIQEGMNGPDNFVVNLKRRAEGQCTGMRGLLEYVYLNKEKIRGLVEEERNKLSSGADGQLVSIQSDHVRNGQKLELPLFSYSTEKDTVVIVEDYRPVVATLYDVQRPLGYLIPKKNTELTDWIERHNFMVTGFTEKEDLTIQQYFIQDIDSLDFEGDPTVNPIISIQEVNTQIRTEDYLFIPVNQLKGNLLILALEPKSTLGLVTYKDFAHLLKKGEAYPVLRVIKNIK